MRKPIFSNFFMAHFVVSRFDIVLQLKKKKVHALSENGEQCSDSWIC
jgi:hypothetical protein